MLVYNNCKLSRLLKTGKGGMHTFVFKIVIKIAGSASKGSVGLAEAHIF